MKPAGIAKWHVPSQKTAHKKTIQAPDNQALGLLLLYSRWDYVNFHVVSICFGVESVFQLITEIINRNKFV